MSCCVNDAKMLYLQVEAGDIIVKVNGTDVHHFTTKEGNNSINETKQ